MHVYMFILYTCMCNTHCVCIFLVFYTISLLIIFNALCLSPPHFVWMINPAIIYRNLCIYPVSFTSAIVMLLDRTKNGDFITFCMYSYSSAGGGRKMVCAIQASPIVCKFRFQMHILFECVFCMYRGREVPIICVYVIVNLLKILDDSSVSMQTKQFWHIYI